MTPTRVDKFLGFAIILAFSVAVYWQFRYVNWHAGLGFAAVIFYMFGIMLKIQQGPTNNGFVNISSIATDPVQIIPIDSIGFSNDPLSFQQAAMYANIKTGGTEYILPFLHSREKVKKTEFRNLPVTYIMPLIEKAYEAATEKQYIEFENIDNLWSDEFTK